MMRNTVNGNCRRGAAVAIMLLSSAIMHNGLSAERYIVPLETGKMSIVSPERFGRRINRVPRKGENPKEVLPWELKDGKWIYTPEMWRGGQKVGYPSISCPMAFMVFSDGSKSILVSPVAGTASPAQPFVEYDPEADAVSVSWRVMEKEGKFHWVAGTASEYAGDWHKAVKAYAEGVFASKALPPRPGYLQNAPAMLLVILKQQNGEIIWPYAEFDKLADVCERLGVNYVGLFGWTRDGHDNFYPDYVPDPGQGGAAALTKGIALLHQRGIYTFLYANGQLQERGKTQYWKVHGQFAAQLGNNGNRYGETWHKYLDSEPHYFDLGCLSDESWKNRMRGLAWQAHALGSKGILYDQLGVGGPRPCHAGNHNHERGAVVYAGERVKFLKDIADEMRLVDSDFIILTEGFHDSILDSCAAFHGWGDCVSLRAAEDFKCRGTRVAEWMPEVLRYMVPSLSITMRVPTPVLTRSAVNYAALFGYMHELEIRYAPDREYLESGIKPRLRDYGTIRQKPDISTMLATEPGIAGGYMKRVCDFQRKYSKYLIAGEFLDTVGVELSGDTKGVAATHWKASDSSEAVLVWNTSNSSRNIAVALGGKHLSACEKAIEPNSLRLYTFNNAEEP